MPPPERDRSAALRSTPVLGRLTVPIVLAPMAGGPSTVELAAAVSAAGGLGVLAGGMVPVDELRRDLGAVRAATDRPFGVNLFSPPSTRADADLVAAYAEQLAPMAARSGVALGRPSTDDDGYADKLRLVVDQPPAVVTFTFGCPAAGTVARLRAAGSEVWVTATSAAEAVAAAAAGADVVVAQGAEAGGHRGSFVDDDAEQLPLAALLAAIDVGLRTTDRPVPVVAAGGLMDGVDVAGVLAAGAAAAQLGTAFLLCPEAGTSPVHRAAVAAPGATTLTRAFSGRRARGIANAWTASVGGGAPSAYPALVHLTRPLRAHGTAVGDPDLVNLWAGTEHRRARELPAGRLVEVLAAELAAARAAGG